MGELEKLSEKLTRLAEEMPACRRALHEELGSRALLEVQQALSEKAKGGTGTLAGMQEYSTGRYGGYAKVQPARGRFRRGYAAGYITNAVENGHRIRRPSGRWRRYRGRITHRYVLGLGFYDLARGRAEKIAIDAAEALLSKVASVFN